MIESFFIIVTKQMKSLVEIIYNNESRTCKLIIVGEKRYTDRFTK